jgi:hypothetical protein
MLKMLSAQHAAACQVLLALWESPETPQRLVKSNPEELEAFETEPDALKQMRNVIDPITASFEDFDLAIEALLKTARLTVEEVIDGLAEPVIERSQKGVIAFQRGINHRTVDQLPSSD